jgi:ketosteroid isomerase-like protein
VSDEAESAVRQAIDVMNHRDVDALDEIADEQVEWHSDPRLPGAEVHRGRDAMKSFLRAFLEQWDEYHLTADEVLTRDDVVLVLASIQMRGMASQLQSEQTIAYLFTVREGKITRGQAFLHQEGAREAFEAAAQ